MWYRRPSSSSSCDGLSRGTTACHTLGARLSLLLLLMIVMQTNTQELLEPSTAINEIVMTLKENMEEMKDQMASMQNILSKLVSKSDYTPKTERKHNAAAGITCPGDFVAMDETEECILIGNHSVTSYQASNRCEYYGGKLFIPKNIWALRKFLNSQNIRNQDYFWIDANDKKTPNFWLWGDDTPVDALTLIYSDRYSSFTGSGYGHCAVFSLKWMIPTLEARSCNENIDRLKSPYLCEVEPGTRTVCPENFSKLPFNKYGSANRCYYSSSDDVPYNEAETFCSSYGGRLPTNPNFLNELQNLNFDESETFQYINFDEGETFWMRQYQDICRVLRFKPASVDDFNIYADTYDSIENATCSSRHKYICTVRFGQWTSPNLIEPSES